MPPRAPRQSWRSELREHFRAKRHALSAQDQSAHASAIQRHVSRSPLMLKSHSIGAYRAEDGAVDLGPTLERLFAMGKQLALPAVRGAVNALTLDFYRYQSSERLIGSRQPMHEPPAGGRHVHGIGLDLVLVPLVAFDEYGVRLGMGTGRYDRFLGALDESLRPRIVGVAHEVQRSRDPLPFDAWDVALDHVVTEAGWQSFQ